MRHAARTPGMRTRGFTLIELMVAVAVTGTLASVAIVNYVGYVEKARVARAVAEIESISRVIEAVIADGEGEYPDALAEVGAENMIDPWGRPYQYLKIFGQLPPGLGSAGKGLPDVAAPPGGPPNGGGGGSIMNKVRKDRFLVPVNSDFDLYSTGADGESKAHLDNKVSLDDVVRARDGEYVGLAEFF